MNKFTSLRSKVVPLPIRDADTDSIIPAQFLTSISREGFGQNLFKRLKEGDPNFPLNQAKFKGAEILVADANFGCGSSREHAVWALTGAGFKVVISKSFADIFYSNSAKNGLLLITLKPEVVDSMLASSVKADYELSISLEEQTVTLPDGKKESFDFDPFRRHCLLEGLDDIDYILSERAAIDRFREQQKSSRFFSTQEANR